MLLAACFAPVVAPRLFRGARETLMERWTELCTASGSVEADEISACRAT